MSRLHPGRVIQGHPARGQVPCSSWPPHRSPTAEPIDGKRSASPMDTVTSRDGTTLAYDRLGDGPPVVLISGGPPSRARPTTSTRPPWPPCSSGSSRPEQARNPIRRRGDRLSLPDRRMRRPRPPVRWSTDLVVLRYRGPRASARRSTTWNPRSNPGRAVAHGRWWAVSIAPAGLTCPDLGPEPRREAPTCSIIEGGTVRPLVLMVGLPGGRRGRRRWWCGAARHGAWPGWLGWPSAGRGRWPRGGCGSWDAPPRSGCS